MSKIKIIDTKGTPVEAEIIFCFSCDETQKNYIALNYMKQVFDKSSSYNNLDLFEISKEENNRLYITDIPDDDWEKVKVALQHKVFSNIAK